MISNMVWSEIAVRLLILVVLVGGGIFALNYLSGLEAGVPDGTETPIPFPSPDISPSSSPIAGPGGCSTPLDCVSFCRDNPSLCFVFLGPSPVVLPAPGRSPLPSGQASPFPTPPIPSFVPSPSVIGEVDVEPTAEELAALEEFFRTLNLDAPLEESGPNGCRTARQCQDYCSANPLSCQGWLFANFPTP